MTSSIDDILKESGISKKDTEDALEALQNANTDLKELINKFGDYTANMTDAISALAEAQIGKNNEINRETGDSLKGNGYHYRSCFLCLV